MAKPQEKPKERKKVWLKNTGIPRRLAHNYFDTMAGTLVPAGTSEVDEELAQDCLTHWPEDFTLADGPNKSEAAAAAAPPADPNAQRPDETLEQFIARVGKK